MKLNIKDQLEKQNMTRYELAKRIDVTYPTITSIYNGDSTAIKLEILENICKALSCTPNDIIVSDDPAMNRLLKYHEAFSSINKKDGTE